MSSDVNAGNVLEEALPVEDETLFLPTDTNARIYQIKRSIKSLRVAVRQSESDFPAPKAGSESKLPPPEIGTFTHEFAGKIANFKEALHRYCEEITRQEPGTPPTKVDSPVAQLEREIKYIEELLHRYIIEDVERQGAEVRKPSRENASSLCHPIPIKNIPSCRDRTEAQRKFRTQKPREQSD